MASVQGILRFGGVEQAKTYYTAYYRSVNGGSAGPGSGQRASQWMRGVYLSEGSGLFSVALSSDNFLGAAATVSNGDQVVVLAWQKSDFTPSEAGGFFYTDQSGVDGTGGTHAVGYKYDNGAAAVANYDLVDRFVSKTFTLTGQSWNATPGGVGGDANGDLELGLNVGPSAVLTGLSTNPASPTAITRGVSYSLVNGSSDTQTARAYSFDGQILFQQSSAAHNPTGGVQTADGSPVDGSVYDFSVGTTYGQAFGTPAGGDVNDVDSSIYAGPNFDNHAHVWPRIDVYAVSLTVKDDNAVGLVASTTGYVRTQYRAASATFGTRQYVSWAQYVADPTEGNANWAGGNPNTVDDVLKLTVNVTNQDATTSRINSVVRGGVFSKFANSYTLPNGSLVITEAGITDGLPVSAPYGFLTVVTQGGQDVLHSYEITATNPGSNSVTIDATGSTEAYTVRDWWMVSTEPAGGTSLTWNWEVSVSGGAWQTVGKSSTLASGLSAGTTVVLTGIGEGVYPGWYFRIVDGPARGYYLIAAVPNDNTLTLAGAGLTVAALTGDTWEVTLRDRTLLWPQRENDALNFRISGFSTRGWPSTGTYIYETAFGPVTNNGSVNNLPPSAVVMSSTQPGASTTYLFDGQASLGTTTTYIQAGTTATEHVLNGSSAQTLIDAAFDSTGLRDGHAWLILRTGDNHVLLVLPIIDVDRETPNLNTLIVDTLGSTLTIPAGTVFQSTNVYEIEPPDNADNDVASYSWVLRSALTPQAAPVSNAEFLANFDRLDGSGTGPTWQYTYSQADHARWACVELSVTDAEGAVATTWYVFQVTVTGAAGGRGVFRVEWD